MTAHDHTRSSPWPWVGLASGVLAIPVLFLAWFEAEIDGIPRGHGNAFDAGVLAWLSMILLFIAGVVAVLPRFRVAVPGMAWLGLAGLSAVLAIISVAAPPGVRDVLELAAAEEGEDASVVTDEMVAAIEPHMEIYPLGGAYIGVFLALVSFVAALLASRAIVGQRPPDTRAG